jgi:hypothetical protein
MGKQRGLFVALCFAALLMSRQRELFYYDGKRRIEGRQRVAAWNPTGAWRRFPPRGLLAEVA